MLGADYIMQLNDGPIIYTPDRLLHSAKPRMLDLYCGIGGATKGYQRAGFFVVGVDYKWQLNYCGDLFVKDQAIVWLKKNLDFIKENFQVIHASPPCQAFTAYRHRDYDEVGSSEIDMIDVTRNALELTGLPYIIENVESAPLRNATVLCGSSFGLDVRRHRLFETNWPLDALPCDHESQIEKGKRFPGSSLRNGRYTCEVGSARIPLERQKQAMGIDWSVRRRDLSQAVPPAYTEYLGKCVMQLI